MWLSSKVFGLFQVSKESVDALRQELAAVRAERDLLKNQVTVSQTQFNWLTLRVNQLEVERAALLEKATGIKTVVPEIVRTPSNIDTMINNFTFDDVGEDMARRLGLPSYDN